MNPHAGQAPTARRWRAWLPGAQVIETPTIDALMDAVRVLHAADIRLLVSVGGDGSLSRLLSVATRVWGGPRLPMILPAAAGSMNMVARQVGWGRRCVRAAAWVAAQSRAAAPPRVHHVRTLVSGDGTVGLTAGFGAPVRFLASYGAGRPGTRRALAQLAHHAWAGALGRDAADRLLAPLRLRWGEHAPTQPAVWSVGLIMRIDALPLRFRVAPGAQGDTAMHLLSGAPTAGQLVRLLPRLFRGADLPAGALRRHRVGALHLAFDEPTSWMLDGEVYPPAAALRLSDGPVLRIPRPG